MTTVINRLLDLKSSGLLASDTPGFKSELSTLNHSNIAFIENELSMKLPTLLIEIYTKVSNGGFGPQYGLMGLMNCNLNEDGDSALQLYQAYCQPDPEDPLWQWPASLLPLCRLGCAMYLCIDCVSDKNPVVWFEPNIHELGESWQNSFIPVAQSFQYWIECWLNKQDLFQDMIDRTYTASFPSRG